MRAFATLCVLGTVLLAACSVPAEPTPSVTERETFAEVAAVYAAKMDRDPRVSDGQRALFDGAVTRGEVALDDVVQAMRAQDECLRESGFTTGGVSVDEQQLPPFATITAISPPAELGEGQAGLVMDSCDASESLYVAWLYSAQPQSVEAYWTRADELAPKIRQCLLDHDIPEDLIGEQTTDIVRAAVKLNAQYGDFAGFPSADCFEGLPWPTRER